MSFTLLLNVTEDYYGKYRWLVQIISAGLDENVPFYLDACNCIMVINICVMSHYAHYETFPLQNVTYLKCYSSD